MAITNDPNTPVVDANNDDTSERNDTITRSEPIADMGDTTGSDGGPRTARSSGEDGETGDSSYSTKPKQSRSDTARVDGPGISGGTGDTDSSQSGGRSQY